MVVLYFCKLGESLLGEMLMGIAYAAQPCGITNPNDATNKFVKESETFPLKLQHCVSLERNVYD